MIPPVGGEMLFERWIFFAKIQKISEPTPTSLLFILKNGRSGQHNTHLTIGHLSSQSDTSLHNLTGTPRNMPGSPHHTSQADATPHNLTGSPHNLITGDGFR